jgi:MFS family permease
VPDPPGPRGRAGRRSGGYPVRVTPRTEAPTYRALLAVPELPRVLTGMQISRIAQMMVSVAIVLFALQEYGSPELAGLVTFVATFPGLLVSPIAGALLDRHGRAKLVVLDYLVALASLVLIGVLALANALPPWLLVAISLVSSFTVPLSTTGLRSLIPQLVPSHLWERVNAVDSNGYVVATIVGPPVAAVMVQVIGGPATIIVIGLLYGVAAIVLVGLRDPMGTLAQRGPLLRDAWDGVVYTWKNRSLRGIGISMTVLNLAGGMLTIVIPLIVLDRLGASEAVVGLLFAIQGLGGMVTASLFGRMDTRGREKALYIVPMVILGLSLVLLLPDAGILLVAVALLIGGATNGPIDIAMFTMRQRRTDPAWMGRAFAVSMAFNFAGYPIGAWITGSLAAVSIDAAVAMGIVAALGGALLGWLLVPALDDRAAARDAARPGAGWVPGRAEDGADVGDAMWPEAMGSGAAGAVALHRLHEEHAEPDAEEGRPDETERLRV